MKRKQTRLMLLCSGLVLAAACGDEDDDGRAQQAESARGSDAGSNTSPGPGPGSADAGQSNPSGPGPSLDAGSGGSTPDTRPASGSSDAGTSPMMSFFVTSDRSANANLGGLAAADMRCQRLAAAVGAGAKKWRAYLSVERDPANGNRPTAAGARIGKGPWYNAKGQLLANDVASLHARSGDAALFLDERGGKINGQWEGSPTPNEHDVLTGTAADGGVATGFTCGDWTLADAGIAARVGHSDGLGPMRNGAPPYSSWFSSHESAGCNDTAPRGGAGRIYCFAAD